MNFSLFPPPIKISLVVPYTLKETSQRLQTRYITQLNQGNDIGLQVKLHLVSNSKYEVTIKRTFLDSVFTLNRFDSTIAKGYLSRQYDATLVEMRIFQRLGTLNQVEVFITFILGLIIAVFLKEYLIALAWLVWCYIVANFIKSSSKGEQELFAKTIRRRLFNDEFRMK